MPHLDNLTVGIQIAVRAVYRTVRISRFYPHLIGRVESENYLTIGVLRVKLLYLRIR